MMKVRIEDTEALAALSIESLRAYLDRDNRWTYAEDIPGKAAVYQHKDKTGRLREVIVPLRRDFADYAARMGDAVATLGRVEDRSELDIYADLRRPDISREVHERIRRWLDEEGWAVRDVPESSSSFNVMVKLQTGQGINIYQLKSHRDHITIHEHLRLDEASQQELNALSDSLQQDILWSIHRDTSFLGVDFESKNASLVDMHFYAFAYFDGLTKDHLIQRILLVLRAATLSVQMIARSFKEAGRPAEAASKLLHLVPSTGGPLTAAS